MKMMSEPIAVILTDSHHDKNNILEVNDILNQALELAVEIGVENIFFLGDAFTSRTGQSLQVLLARRDWIKKCSDNGIRITEIPGNHDKTDLDSPDSYLDIYDGLFDNYRLIREGEIVQFDNLACCFLPYFLENGSYPNRLADLCLKARKSGKKKILLTHIAVDGVKNNDGTLVENTLKLSSFADFDKVLVGHYHNRSTVGKNIHYIGSPRPKDFGEDNNKGFTILYENGDIEFHKAKFKQFIKVNIDLSKVNEKQLKTITTTYSGIEHNVRFVFQGEEEDLALISSKEYSKLGIDVKKEPLRIAKSMKAAEHNEVVRFDKGSILKSFLEYCKENEITGDIKKFGLRFIK